MDGSTVFWLMLGFLVAEFGMERWLEALNRRAMEPVLPERLKGFYDEGEYGRFQRYKRDQDRLGSAEAWVSFAVTAVFLCAGGFGWWDGVVDGLVEGEVWRTLVFMAGLGLAGEVMGLPFGWAETFGVEARYGFNKTTRGTWWGDWLKGMAVSAVVGGLLLSALVLFWEWAGRWFWLYAWGAVTVFSVFMGMFYSELVVPLFNKQTPLGAGTLREKIEGFAREAGFRLKDIYVIDGSRRSTKANAYFTGLGRRKRIVLYDTLLKELTEEEVVAVLAHEVGHYRRRHTVRFMLASILQTGVMLWLFSLLAGEPAPAEALGGEGADFQLGLVAFSLLYGPVGVVLGVAVNGWSRRCEYEADAYAAEHYSGALLASGLKKISVKALSNLTPHPWYERVYYSHPSLLKRLERLTINDEGLMINEKIL